MTDILPFYDEEDRVTWRAFMAAALTAPGDYTVEFCASIADEALREYGWRCEAGEMEQATRALLEQDGQA